MFKELNRRSLYLMAGIAVALALVNAAVFVYFPMNIGLSPQNPPIYFDLGSNAGGSDLWGNTISVSTSQANTILNIQVHPTYQTNYYKNIATIKRQDTTHAYYVLFKVTDAISDTNVTSAYLIITNSTTGEEIARVDLTNTMGVQPSSWISISSSDTLNVSLEITISPSNGVTYNTSPHLEDGSATVQLIFSPQGNEMP